MNLESADNPSTSTGKSTGSLQPSPQTPAGQTAARSYLNREVMLRLGELVIFLVAAIGAIALGLGITDYFRDHRYVAAYLIAYAGFQIAYMLVRIDDTEPVAPDELTRRISNQLPILILFAAAPFERTYLYGGEAPSWVAALGLLVALAGLWLALGARIQLGFFSMDKAGSEPRLLVRSGFYRYIRHPVYAGVFLLLLAWPLQYGAPISALLTLIVGCLVASRYMRDEEAQLVARFGEEYEEYRRVTDALIPTLW